MAVGVQVAGVKELNLRVAQLGARGRVEKAADVVKGAEAAREGDMGVVVEAGVAEDEEAVLGVGCQWTEVVTVPTANSNLPWQFPP